MIGYLKSIACFFLFILTHLALGNVELTECNVVAEVRTGTLKIKMQELLTLILLNNKYLLGKHRYTH